MKRNRKATTAIIALSTVLAVSASAQDPTSTAKQVGLTNPSFEEPILQQGKEYDYFTTMPGWTTTDEKFEIWRSGHEGVAAHEGTQFVELNYLNHGTLYQDSTDIKAGTILEFTFAHRGRKGDDTMRLTITDLGANNVPDGGDDTVLFTKTYITGNAAWKVYDSKTEEPKKALGNTIRFAYEAVATSTENLAVGNLLDAANFGVGVLLPTVTSRAEKKEGVYFISGTVDWAGYAKSDMR